jgi:serine/threonine-protein kinase
MVNADARNLSRTQDGPDPLQGMVLDGRYRLAGLIARGSMGKVYLAEQLPLGRKVAVKVLDIREGYVESDSTSERFLREASTLARLSHPSTVRVFDFGVWEGHDCLVMEYVPGETLSEVLRTHHALTPLRSLRIARQIASSLREAHGLGVVHRDLKLSNVLLARDGDQDVIKVIDFGLVKDLGSSAELTGKGQMLGSPLYMAPEALRGAPVDARADLYGLGVILYRLLTGKRPFHDADVRGALKGQAYKPPIPMSEQPPKHPVPQSVEVLVMRCLEKDPGARPQSAEAVIAELDRCLAELTSGTPAPAPVPAAPAAAPMRLGLYVGLLVALLAAAGLGSWAVVRVLAGGEQPIEVFNAEPDWDALPPAPAPPEPAEPIPDPAPAEPDPVAPDASPDPEPTPVRAAPVERPPPRVRDTPPAKDPDPEPASPAEPAPPELRDPFADE